MAHSREQLETLAETAARNVLRDVGIQIPPELDARLTAIGKQVIEALEDAGVEFPPPS